jgi:hypothetical protein
MEGAAATQLRTSNSPAPLPSAKHEGNERRDDRIETIAIAISLLMMISGLAAIVAAVLLSRPLLRASDWLISRSC